MAYIGKVPADVLVDPLVTSASLVDGTIITADIADDAVTSAKLAANSVDSSELIDGSVDNSHLAGSIAINKTLLAGGTGLTLSTNTLNVDAAQTQITSVGTIGTGVWNASVIASAKLDADTAHLSEAQTFSGAKTFSDDVTISSGKGLIVSWAEGTNSGSYISQFSNLDSTNNQSNGVLIQAGAGASDKALAVRNYAGTDMFIVKGDSSSTFAGDISLASTKKLWFDSANWSIGKLTSPTGASAVTGAAVVVDVYDGSTHGFMVRNTSNESLLEIVGSTKTATFAGALTIHGATAKVWHSAVKPFHIGGVATIGVDVTNGYTQLYENAYLDANDNYKFIENGRATMVYQGNGTHAIRVSTSDNSGGADQALSWTNALLIGNTGNATFGGDVSVSGGNLSIGEAVGSHNLRVIQSSNATAGISIRSTQTNPTSNITFTTNTGSVDWYIGKNLTEASSGSDFHIATAQNGSAKLTLDSSGNATFAGGVNIAGTLDHTRGAYNQRASTYTIHTDDLTSGTASSNGSDVTFEVPWSFPYQDTWIPIQINLQQDGNSATRYNAIVYCYSGYYSPYFTCAKIAEYNGSSGTIDGVSYAMTSGNSNYASRKLLVTVQMNSGYNWNQMEGTIGWHRGWR